MSLACAAGRTTSMPARMTSLNSQGRTSKRTLPETMRDTSITSSMSCTMRPGVALDDVQPLV